MCGAFSSDKLLITMKKLSFFTVMMFIGTLCSVAWGIDLETVALKDISSTGKSILLDLGTLDEVEEGSVAKFFVQLGPIAAPKVFLVAEGQLVKAMPKQSYWFLKNIMIPKAIKKDSKLLMLTMEKVNNGRTLTLKSKTIVRSAEDYEELQEFLNENSENVPNRLVKEGHNFEATSDVFSEESNSTDPDKNVDVLLTNYEVFKTTSGNSYTEEYGDMTNQRYFVNKVEVDLGDIKKAEDKKLLDAVAINHQAKTNNMKYGLKGFYADQEKLKEIPDMSKHGSNDSVYKNYKAQEKEASVIHPKVAAKMKRDGTLWSADMDEAALRRYFIQSGLDKEIKRRELARSELDGHEIMLHFSNGLSTHGNPDDPNYQGRGYNFGFGYDLHLSRVTPNWKNWSIQFLLEKEQGHYSTGLFNAKSKEFSYGAYLNYYFVNNPLTLDTMIFLAGIGMKSGSSTVTSSYFSKEYSYQVLTTPALQLMGKYRFRTGDLMEDTVNVGASVNFGLNVDFKNLSTNEELEDEIDGKFSVVDLKYTIGMSLFF